MFTATLLSLKNLVKISRWIMTIRWHKFYFNIFTVKIKFKFTYYQWYNIDNTLKFHFGTVFTTTPVSLMWRLQVLHLKETIDFGFGKSAQEMIEGHDHAPWKIYSFQGVSYSILFLVNSIDPTVCRKTAAFAYDCMNYRRQMLFQTGL